MDRLREILGQDLLRGLRQDLWIGLSLFSNTVYDLLTNFFLTLRVARSQSGTESVAKLPSL